MDIKDTLKQIMAKHPFATAAMAANIILSHGISLAAKDVDGMGFVVFGIVALLIVAFTA